MPFNTRKKFQDIAFFHIEKPAPAAEKKCNIALVVGVTITVTVMLLGLGYCIGVRAGWVEPPCCIGGLNFDFEFDASKR